MSQIVKHALFGLAVLGICAAWQVPHCGAQSASSTDVKEPSKKVGRLKSASLRLMEKPFEPIVELEESEMEIRDQDGTESEDFPGVLNRENTQAKVIKESTGFRLPRYFAGLVDTEQRSQIRDIQLQFRSRMAQLEGELEMLRRQEQLEMEQVLTASQRKLLDMKRQQSKISSVASSFVKVSPTEHPDPSESAALED